MLLLVTQRFFSSSGPGAPRGVSPEITEIREVSQSVETRDVNGLSAMTSGCQEARMLVLSRKPLQSIMIGPDIKITIVKVERNQVRIGIECPAMSRSFETSSSRPGRPVPRMSAVASENRGRLRLIGHSGTSRDCGLPVRCRLADAHGVTRSEAWPDLTELMASTSGADQNMAVVLLRRLLPYPLSSVSPPAKARFAFSPTANDSRQSPILG